MWLGLWPCLWMVERMVSPYTFQVGMLHYKKERVEAFTDGVFAIAATFIALELKAENETNAAKWLKEHSDKIIVRALAFPVSPSSISFLISDQ